MNDTFLPTNLSQISPLYKKAFTLAHHNKKASYERLEFLGDRVLGLIIAELLYKHFPSEKEGTWAMRFTRLVCEQTLANIAREIGLPERLITQDDSLRDNNSILADVVEAFIAALYLDKGMASAKAFVQRYWLPLLLQPQDKIKDSKSALQEWAQKNKNCLPEYHLIACRGPDHAPQFEMEVRVADSFMVRAIGSSKKEAEQKAADELLKQLPFSHNQK